MIYSRAEPQGVQLVYAAQIRGTLCGLGFQGPPSPTELKKKKNHTPPPVIECIPIKKLNVFPTLNEAQIFIA